MKNIRYRIEFFSYWHCGSGLSAGADVDALVVKDSEGLPFVPGKTIKGLVREAASLQVQVSGAAPEILLDCFGTELIDCPEDAVKGCSFFSNAELSVEERKAIIDNNVQQLLYEGISSTAIDEKGLAKDFSLRRIQATVPCVLYGSVLDVPEDAVQLVENSLKMVKRIGQNRNRGLGRCQITIEKN